MSTTPAVNDVAIDTAAAVRRVIADVLVANQTAQVSGLESVPDDVLLGKGGLEVSSLLLLQVFVKLEEVFAFTFEDAAVANTKLYTVGELVRFVDEAIRQRRATPGGTGE